MNILQLTHRLPYPLVDGGKIGIYNFTKHYHNAGHAVNLICIAPQEERAEDLTALTAITSTMKVFWKDTRNKKIALLGNTFFSSLPYNMEKYIFSDVERYILEFCGKYGVDVVHVDHLHMSYYAQKIRERFPRIKLAIREHNVESTILERYYRSQKKSILKWVFKMQYIRLKKYEKSFLPIFDAILAITPEDAERIRLFDEKLTAKTYVIPAGTDCNSIHPVDCSANNGILHLAAMDWLPNQEGLKWFIKDVFPIILKKQPSLQLFVVGKNTPQSFHKYEGKNIKVLGFVENTQQVVSQCMLAVVPLFAGGGMRIKILNYLAQGIPVVSTTIGAEGISVKDKEHVLLANSAEKFAACVLDVFHDETLRRKLILNGRKLVEKYYSWESVITETIAIFDKLRQGEK
jgi:polysaccharide biosynthesis protein PslH